MKRKMTALAFASKCGGFGANGFAAGAACVSRASSDPSAIEPRPMPQSRKKWRRVFRIPKSFMLTTNRLAVVPSARPLNVIIRA
jgi:hypothetical protein